MSKLVRIVTSASLVGLFVVALLEVPALLPAANASIVRGPTQLIDTDLVVGLAQRTAVTPAPQASHEDLSSHRAIAPTITSQPSNDAVTTGSVASFSAAASGTPTPSVQWRRSLNGRSWTTIRGATSTAYSFVATSSDNGEEFDAVFSNSAGSVTTIAALLTVTAVSTSYTVTFNANGGAGSMAPQTASAPTPLTLNAFTDSGYTFADWNTAANGSGTTYTNGATYPFTSSTTLYAQWTAVSTSYTVTFNANGGAGSMAPQTASAPTPLTLNAFTDSGYTFADWNTAANGSGTTYTNGATYPFTSSTTLYAQWTAVSTSYQESSNWSGYVDTGSTFSAVSGSWTVPTVTCQGSTSSYSAEWIGIDGDTSNTVEQDGTETDCLNGSPSYDAWFEMYGDSAVNSGDEVELSPATNPVSPGDSMIASVSVSGHTWTLSIDDTTRWSAAYSTTVSFSAAAESSAEWVVERPEICSHSCSLTSLADFGSVGFTNAETTNTAGTNEPISASSDSAIEMVSGATVLALPGALDPTGMVFTDAWKAS